MNIFDEEQLIAYWGKGLDKFTIKCLREKNWLPNNRYINICYKGIVFTQVFFYVYATDARVVGEEIVFDLFFVSKFERGIRAELLVTTTRGCYVVFLDAEHSDNVCYMFARELNRFVVAVSRSRVRSWMIRILRKSGVLLSVGVLTKIVYFMRLLEDGGGWS